MNDHEPCLRFDPSARRRWLCGIGMLMAMALGTSSSVAATPPVILGESAQNEGTTLRLPNGSLKHYFVVTRNGSEIGSVTSFDEGVTWSSPVTEFSTPNGTRGFAARAYVGNDGEVQLYYLNASGGQRIWQAKSSNSGTTWTDFQQATPVTSGALRSIEKLSSGRLLLGFHDPHPAISGAHRAGAAYSDDDGATWTVSPSRMEAPRPADFNGNLFGAVEPTFTELNDGRVWMLMRTQADLMYESFSNDSGETWEDARPSRFYGSSSPSTMIRLSDDRLVYFWNNQPNQPKWNGQKVYSGRDVLHAAISDDDGQTWHGFREVYADPTRNGPQSTGGDSGTAYPNLVELNDGNILLTTGQRDGRRGVVRIDPDWLQETHHQDAFANGLDTWQVYKQVGSVSGSFRDRVQGPDLISHPTLPGEQVLHIRKPDLEEPDAAVWNFPAGESGSLTTRVMLNSGFQGASFALTDRMANPGDETGEQTAMFNLALGAGGQIGEGGPIVPLDSWFDLTLDWSASTQQADVLIDGVYALSLPVLNGSKNGLSYIRFRSSAEDGTIDADGFYLDSVSVDVIPPSFVPSGEAGDLNQDGLLDQDDVDAFVAGWLTSGYLGEQGMYAHGDLNLDGITNLADAFILRAALAAQGSAFPFEALAAVPEPSSGVLAFLGCFLGLGSLRRRVGRGHR